MNHCVFQQNALAACDEMRSSVTIPENRKDSVVCPKPRRLGLLNHTLNDPIRTLRWQLSHQTELNDIKAGNELMEMLIHGGQSQTQSQPQSQSQSAVAVAQFGSSPPFFSGSPPSRASNPLVQDARFGEEKPRLPTPLSPLSITATTSSPRKGGSCVRAKFGHKPAPVRIEGFDCLDRDRRNCSIPAVA